MTDWKRIETAPENVVVMTKIDDGETFAHNIQPLVKRGRLWWLADGSMYVYYEPTHWKEIESK